MSELRTRFEKLRSRETLFEADGFRFVLFGALVNGTNVDEIIKPLPRDFLIPNTTKPNLELLRTHYQKLTTAPIEKVFIDPTTILLLKHIFSDERFDMLRIPVEELGLNDDDFIAMMHKSLEKLPCAQPEYVFKLIKHSSPAKAEVFESLKREHGSFYAFHGTPLQNVRSICEFGLVSMFNRREAFGSGVYCADYVAVSFDYAPFEYNYFETTQYGGKISVILLVEIINHPLLSDNSNTSNFRKPSYVHVVPNADWIRVDSIFLYTDYLTRERQVNAAVEEKEAKAKAKILQSLKKYDNKKH